MYTIFIKIKKKITYETQINSSQEKKTTKRKCLMFYVLNSLQRHSSDNWL